MIHARLAPPRRSPHRAGRLTPDHLLDGQAAARTVCGAEATTLDLSNRDARTRAGRAHLSCDACREALA